LSDADFFNNVYLNNQDYLILMVPDKCKECQGLMKEFEKSKEKIAEEAPDLNIGYIHRPKSDNVLLRRALDANVQSSSLTVKAFVKNRLFKYEGRINMKRLEKWLREIAEKLESEARSPPSGIIQMNSAMLHHISKDIEQPFNLLLVPAHLFMSKDQKFRNSLEKVVEKIDPSICLGLVEEDMSLEELGEFNMESDNLIFVQKSIGGYLFVDVKEFKSTEISDEDVASWIETVSVPRVSKVDRKDDLALAMKEKEYVILGYSAPGNTERLSSMTKTVGKLATTIKSELKSKSTDDFDLIDLYMEKSGFFLSTNTIIAHKFGLEQGVTDAIIIIFKDVDSKEDSKVFSILEKRFENDKNPIKEEAMVNSLQSLLFGVPPKDEL